MILKPVFLLTSLVGIWSKSTLKEPDFIKIKLPRANFYLSTFQGTFASYTDYCRSQNFNVANILDQDEQNRIASKLMKYNVNSAYIGAVFNFDQKDWVWLNILNDTLSDMDFENWDRQTDQPDYSGANTISIIQNNQGKLADSTWVSLSKNSRQLQEKHFLKFLSHLSFQFSLNFFHLSN